MWWLSQNRITEFLVILANLAMSKRFRKRVLDFLIAVETNSILHELVIIELHSVQEWNKLFFL